ncbi:MAG: histidinol dehydrogenase [Nanoarchaeota archaeon]|nr:histidinol dehydrogenase [Nanoarchaeota archaeon]
MKQVTLKTLDEEFFRRDDAEEIASVKPLLADVRKRGDAAVRELTERFDKVRLDRFEVSKEEIKDAYKEVGAEAIAAIKAAAENIREFAKAQFSQLKSFEIRRNGARLGQRVIPLERVGCYVPGGGYPLPSTALMTVIPAKVAGVKEVIICSPKIVPSTIVAADIAGADKIYQIGGVQAIAAMAYGTETIPRVDKIVGPGNAYVTAAKKEVYGLVGIDFLAGPSEVLIIADETGDAEIIAADLLAQAEHDVNARADLITTSETVAQAVSKALIPQLAKLKTRDIAQQSIDKGRIILVEKLSEAFELANKRAPEHLELFVSNPEKGVPSLTSYGSLFIGENSAEVFGDYGSTGTNHVLPTNGAARYMGGLSVKEYVKILTYQQVDEKIEQSLIDIAATLADVEGLYAHKAAALARQKNAR